MKVECCLLILLSLMAISSSLELAGGGRRWMQKQRHKFSSWKQKEEKQKTASINSRLDEPLPSATSIEKGISSKFNYNESSTFPTHSGTF